LGLFEETGDHLGIAFYYRARGDMAFQRDEMVESDRYYHEYLARSAQDRRDWSVVYAYAGLGRIALAQKRLDKARHYFMRALALGFNIGNRDLCMIPLAGLASVLAAEGRDEEALALSAFVLDNPLTWLETRQQVKPVLEQLRARLPETAAQGAQARWPAQDVELVVKSFLALNGDIVEDE
jgi:tetratricopeptide (TPR) repeat protein